MAGTLFGLGLQSQFDASGNLARGCLLYVYAENSTTPSVTYADFALGNVQTWPVEADGAGRLPQIWVADGAYRARLTTSTGVEIFDEQSITAIGASTGGASSGGSATTDNVFQAGDMLWQPITGTRSGWVRCNALTIGSGSSGATERANADTQSLYEYLWNNFSDTLCPVSTGRGGSATADFNASKTIGVLDMRGRSAFGLDDMGNSAASVLTAGTPTAAASSGGAEKQTIAKANLPSYNLSVSGLSVGTTITNGSLVTRNSSATTNNNAATGGGANIVNTISLPSATLSLADGSISGTLPSGGSGTTLATTPPYRLGTWYIKL